MNLSFMHFFSSRKRRTQNYKNRTIETYLWVSLSLQASKFFSFFLLLNFQAIGIWKSHISLKYCSCNKLQTCVTQAQSTVDNMIIIRQFKDLCAKRCEFSIGECLSSIWKTHDLELPHQMLLMGKWTPLHIRPWRRGSIARNIDHRHWKSLQNHQNYIL